MDLPDDPKRKNQFWLIVTDKQLLVQAKTPYEKQMWLDDLSRWFPKSRREEKKPQKHEELLERQKEQDLQSLRQREERKNIDPNSFSSATEVPKGYVPEEQMKITRAPSGRGKPITQGSSTIDLQIPGRISDHSSPPSPTTITSSSSTNSFSSSSSTPSSDISSTPKQPRVLKIHPPPGSSFLLNSKQDIPSPTIHRLSGLSNSSNSPTAFSIHSTYSSSPSKQENELYL